MLLVPVITYSINRMNTESANSSAWVDPVSQLLGYLGEVYFTTKVPEQGRV